MENGSKALLIAGAVFITIIVVSIVMFIFYRAERFNKDRIEELNEKEIAIHNSQFETYQRKLSKSEVQKLVKLVLENNKNVENSNFIVSITFKTIKYIYNKDTLDMLANKGDNHNLLDKINQIDSLDSFSCSVNIDSNGIINNIVIK